MEQNEASKAQKKKKKKKDQEKAWHEINLPAEKGHGHGPAIVVENIADVFLASYVLVPEFPLIYIITLLALLRIEQILRAFKP